MTRPCSRRTFLGVAATAPLALNAACGGSSSSSPSPTPTPGASGATVAITRARSYGSEAAAALREAITLLGGLSSLVSGKTVTVKVNFTGWPIQPLAGRSLLPALMNPAARVHPAEEAIGYELSGNQALFKGDLKLVRNLPPVGDGQWHLYDLRKDPGETRDLQQALPDAFKAMQQEYDAWARAHGVLPIPEGYRPARQVLINSLRNYWIPAYGTTVLAWLAGLVVLVVVVVRMRRRKRAG
jgi:hypothetical protein